jgi:ankyrin repeat protein
LIWAAERGHTEIVNSLIAAVASIDVKEKHDMTALIMAAEKGHTVIVN